jgi:hypothetical protein
MGFAITCLRTYYKGGFSEMSNWWKCQIIRNSIVPFIKGDVVLAKNGEKFITLFDGRREVSILKMDVKNLKLLRRLNSKETSLIIERDYQSKRASKLMWDTGLDVN